MIQSNLPIMDVLYNGHFFKEPAELWSNFLQKNLYIAETFIADIFFNGHSF